MRICHISSMHEWDDDRIYQRACLGLARAGYEVHFVATKPDRLPVENLIEFHWIKRRSGLRRRLISSREAILKAIETNSNVFHVHDPDILPHVKKLSKAHPDSRIVYDIHENYAARFSMWGLPAFLGRLFRNYELSVIKKIDGYIAVTESMAGLFSSTSTPFCVVRNTVDTVRLKKLNLDSIIADQPPIFYTSGTHTHARQCLQTVQAIKYVNSSLNYKVMFVGRYQSGLKEEMRNQAQADNTSSKLCLEDMLPWEENFLRTARAFCGCVFYEDNLNNRVTVPNRIFEYMFCGIPLICSDFPELRKIVEDTKCGIIINSVNPELIANAFEYLLTHPEKARIMGQNGKKAVGEKYSYHIDLSNLEEFYKALL